MRVIAGIAKGRRLAAPPGSATRPTADRVKEALFSSLQTVIGGARVLDLYAGSGSLGIEALSRGAEHATFVEQHARTVGVLRQNLELTTLVTAATVVQRDALATLRAAPPGAPYDVVLADPPYAIDRGELADVLAALAPHLAAEAIVVVELHSRGDAPRWPAELRATRERRYGDTTLYSAEAGVSA